MSGTNSTEREETALAGVSVLVVEDDYLIAKEVVSTLIAHGANVLGPVPDIAHGKVLLDKTRPSCALLDINLKGQFVFELAQELVALGVPPIFTTGYDASFIPEPLNQIPCLQKPIDMRTLIRSIRKQVGAPPL